MHPQSFLKHQHFHIVHQIGFTNLTTLKQGNIKSSCAIPTFFWYWPPGKKSYYTIYEGKKPNKESMMKITCCSAVWLTHFLVFPSLMSVSSSNSVCGCGTGYLLEWINWIFFALAQLQFSNPSPNFNSGVKVCFWLIVHLFLVQDESERQAKAVSSSVFNRDITPTIF